jgi:hypothetical protein
MRERAAVEAYLRLVNDAPAHTYRSVPIEELERRLANETSLAAKAILIAKLHEARSRTAAIEQDKVTRQALEDGFVKYVGGFSARHHVTYAVWREMGVPVKVLQRAGIPGAHPQASAGTATPFSEHKGGPGPRVAEHARKRPYKPRRKLTPEFLAEVLATYEAAGGGAAGYRAVAEKYDYGDGHAAGIVRQARKAHWTGPPLRIKDPDAQITHYEPEATDG